jgi:hypothetical protein
MAAPILHVILSFFLRNWFGEYGHAYDRRRAACPSWPRPVT